MAWLLLTLSLVPLYIPTTQTHLFPGPGASQLPSTQASPTLLPLLPLLAVYPYSSGAEKNHLLTSS